MDREHIKETIKGNRKVSQEGDARLVGSGTVRGQKVKITRWVAGARRKGNED